MDNDAWTAGLFEGEGCVYHGTNRGYHVWRLTLTSTDLDVLQRFHQAVGLGSVRGPYTSGKAHHRPYWTWELNRRDDINTVLTRLYPYMGERRKAKMDEFFKYYQTHHQQNHHPNHCRRDHEMTEANTIIRSGRKTCRRCENDRQNERRRLKRLRGAHNA